MPPALRLGDAAGHLIRRAQQRHGLLWARQFGPDLDVTGPQYALLSAVSGSEGVDQGRAGDLASLDKSSAADVVARLERNGWIRFVRDREDGRRKALRLTPLGRTALPEVTRRARAVQELLLSPVPPADREPFVAALRLVAFGGQPPGVGGADRPVLALGDTPGHLIRRAQQIHTVLWGDEVGRAVTAPQYAVLSAVACHPGGVDQGTAGELASLDKASMTEVVRRLVARDRLVRERDTVDGRRRLLCLTDAVRDELAHLTPRVERVQERLLEPLDEVENRTFMTGCRRLAYADEELPQSS